MTRLALEVIGGLVITLGLCGLCYFSARTFRFRRRASKQLRLTREMRRAFEDEHPLVSPRAS